MGGPPRASRPFRRGAASADTGILIEVVEIDTAGNCRVLDASAPLDAEPLLLRQMQIRSCTWQRVDTGAGAKRLAV